MYLIKYECCIACDMLLSDRKVTSMTQHSLAAVELCLFESLLR